MATLQQLLDHKAQIEREIADVQRSSRNEAIAAIRALMAQHGLTAADLVSSVSAGTKRSKIAGSKVAPKYRHPGTGATWTGRGLKPKWMVDEIARGRMQTDFAI